VASSWRARIVESLSSRSAFSVGVNDAGQSAKKNASHDLGPIQTRLKGSGAFKRA
jgi:hypothetical protein